MAEVARYQIEYTDRTDGSLGSVSSLEGVYTLEDARWHARRVADEKACSVTIVDRASKQPVEVVAPA